MGSFSDAFRARIHERKTKRNQVSKPTSASCVSQRYVFYGILNHIKYRRFAWLAFHESQQELLFSLAIPRSYPCLAPPPHHDCCRAPRISISDRGLPSYEDAITHKLEDNSLPPNYSDAVSMMNAATQVSSQTQTSRTTQTTNNQG
ncbi:hypothetical protein Y032_0088g2166 [Ancylostoma ceylanicum]|uniref:Uncharacterized protein n=1 Tax=Ancylostoma ceylanicum TaxID=53326 RepID=A0A016TPH3_9BILA|nr:hypothetical protein Y032_0088g2166 [Ancylostoma ceylanicum]